VVEVEEVMLRCGAGVRRCVVVLCLRHLDFEYDRREGFRDRTACNRSPSGAYVGGWVGSRSVAYTCAGMSLKE
jgi:hypothetical protein